jgi:hypothetical protein
MTARSSLAVLIVCLAASSARADAGWTEEVVVPHAAYSIEGAPSAVVHAPAGFDPARPLHLVVYLHGYRGCARVLMGQGELACKAGVDKEPGWDLARVHDEAGGSSLFVLAQLGFLNRSAHPGCFARAGCFRSFIEEVLAALPARLAGKTLQDVAEITLVAHSAGFRSALSVLEHGGITERIRSVVLLDALYADQARFVAVVAAHPRMRLWSLHIGAGEPARNNKELAKLARKKLGAGGIAEIKAEPSELGKLLAGKRVVVLRVESSHRELPQKHLGAILRALRE